MFGKNQTAIVTGGNSGIGEAIVHALTARGMNVVVAGRRQEENERVAAEVADRFGIEALPISVDVSKESECHGLIETAVQKFGSVELLVNNAGIGAGGKIMDTDTETFDRVMKTNLYSTYWCSRSAYASMLENEVVPENGLRGGIINISSLCGVEAWSGVGAYATSKHGVMGLSRAMADEGAEDQIRVAAVCPAMVATPMTGASGPDVLTPEDIAKTVTYLLDLSSAAWPKEIVLNRRGAD